MGRRKTLLTLLCVIVLKIVFAYHLVALVSCANPERKLGELSVSAGDTFAYTGAMENYIKEGSYYFNNGKEDVYAGRLPHYSIPYWIFRQVLNESNAYDALILFQLLIESVAILFMATMVVTITNKSYAFWLTLILMVCSLNWTNYSYYASPESLSTSLIVFFLWSYLEYKKSYSNKFLLATGFFLGLLVCLKAYFILVFIPIGIQFILDKKQNLRSTKSIEYVLKSTIVVSLPITLLLTPWIIRNYNVYGKFIPLQITTTAGYNYTSSDFAYRKFLQSWGGDLVHWEKSAAGCYFIPSNLVCDFEFPSYAFTSGYSIRDIEEVRNKYVLLQSNYYSELDSVVTSGFARLTEIYKKERPFRYYILTPLIFVKKFLIHSGSFYLPIHVSNPCYGSFQFPIKIFQSLIYWISLTLGFMGLIRYSIDTNSWTLIFIPIFLIALFPVAFRSVEWRLFQTSFPVLIMGLIYCVTSIQKGVNFLRIFSHT